MLSPTLDIHEAAALARCHPDTMRKMMKSGEAPGTKIGRAWVVTQPLFENWLNGEWRRRRAWTPPAIREKRLQEIAEKIAARMLPYKPNEKPVRKRKPGSFYAAKRKAAILQRTPAWADKTAIMAIYATCERISKETGIKHNVDHIVPLQGATVSGLHVAENLSIIHATANAVKHNRWETDATP
jgi:5-methylcytosine-specific restriction endonuclease McrA